MAKMCDIDWCAAYAVTDEAMYCSVHVKSPSLRPRLLTSRERLEERGREARFNGDWRTVYDVESQLGFR